MATITYLRQHWNQAKPANGTQKDKRVSVLYSLVTNASRWVALEWDQDKTDTNGWHVLKAFKKLGITIPHTVFLSPSKGKSIAVQYFVNAQPLKNVIKAKDFDQLCRSVGRFRKALLKYEDEAANKKIHESYQWVNLEDKLVKMIGDLPVQLNDVQKGKLLSKLITKVSSMRRLLDLQDTNMGNVLVNKNEATLIDHDFIAAQFKDGWDKSWQLEVLTRSQGWWFLHKECEKNQFSIDQIKSLYNIYWEGDLSDPEVSFMVTQNLYFFTLYKEAQCKANQQFNDSFNNQFVQSKIEEYKLQMSIMIQRLLESS